MHELRITKGHQKKLMLKSDQKVKPESHEILLGPVQDNNM